MSSWQCQLNQVPLSHLCARLQSTNNIISWPDTWTEEHCIQNNDNVGFLGETRTCYTLVREVNNTVMLKDRNHADDDDYCRSIGAELTSFDDEDILKLLSNLITPFSMDGIHFICRSRYTILEDLLSRNETCLPIRFGLMFINSLKFKGNRKCHPKYQVQIENSIFVQ